MPYLLVFLVGFGLGWLKAGKKGGNLPDKLQYGAVFGMVGMILLLYALTIFANLVG